MFYVLYIVFFQQSKLEKRKGWENHKRRYIYCTISNHHMNGPVQVKPVLFKGHLYTKCNDWTYIRSKDKIWGPLWLWGQSQWPSLLPVIRLGQLWDQIPTLPPQSQCASVGSVAWATNCLLDIQASLLSHQQNCDFAWGSTCQLKYVVSQSSLHLGQAMWPIPGW